MEYNIKNFGCWVQWKCLFYAYLSSKQLLSNRYMKAKYIYLFTIPIFISNMKFLLLTMIIWQMSIILNWYSMAVILFLVINFEFHLQLIHFSQLLFMNVHCGLLGFVCMWTLCVSGRVNCVCDKPPKSNTRVYLLFQYSNHILIHTNIYHFLNLGIKIICAD